MTTEQWKILGKDLLAIIWPLKGIIYADAVALTILYAYTRAYIHYGWLIIFGLAVIFAIRSTAGAHTCTRGILRFVGNVLMHIVVICIRVIFAWVYLCIGIFAGRMDNRFQPPTLRVHTGGPHLRFALDSSNLSWHYRFGRWMYRGFNNLLNRIPVIHENNLAAILARVICAILVFWNIWDLPRFLTT